MKSLQKIGKCSEGSEEPYTHKPEFEMIETSNGSSRINATVPEGDAALIQALAARLKEPVFLLYVLHTTRGEGPVGRYQAGPLAWIQVSHFLERFRKYLQADGRFDLWLHSEEREATIVWDRHNLLYLYGPIEEMKSDLISLGFKTGKPGAAFAHAHYYRPEFDSEARALLEHLEWTHSDLRPEDVQRA